MKELRYIVLLALILISFHLYAQDSSKKDEERLIQFSGIVVTADSLRPVPFTNIMIKNTHRGAVADFYGYFSFVALPSDTVIFSAVGYKKSSYIIPDTITLKKYTLIKAMTADTILLDETLIYPWPTREQFKEAFVKLQVPDDDLARAMKNLALAEMREMALNTPMDGSMNYKNYMQWEVYNKNYYIGQTQPISLLDPFAWAQFFKAWKEGKFKKKKN